MYSGDKELQGSRHKDSRNNNKYFGVSCNNKINGVECKNAEYMKLFIRIYRWSGIAKVVDTRSRENNGEYF